MLSVNILPLAERLNIAPSDAVVVQQAATLRGKGRDDIEDGRSSLSIESSGKAASAAIAAAKSSITSISPPVLSESSHIPVEGVLLELDM